MTQYDQLILLAVLGAVAGMLVLVARQGRTRIEMQSAEKAAPAEVKPSPIVEAPRAPEPTVVVVPADPPGKPKRVKSKSIAVSAPKETPIDSVLAMLRKKDALAKAFLLREILDPPVSMRRLRRGEL